MKMSKVVKVLAAFIGETEFALDGAFITADKNPDGPQFDDVVSFTMERGVKTGGNAGYRVAMRLGDETEGNTNVKTSEIMGSAPAAFKKALALWALAPGAVSADLGLKTLFPQVPKAGDNNPPEAVLTEQDATDIDAFIVKISEDLEALASSEKATRVQHLNTANSVTDLRLRYASKKMWAAVKAEKLAPMADGPTKALLMTNANAVGYMVNFSRAAQNVDLWAAMPERLQAPRTFEKELGIVRGMIAANIVAGIVDEVAVEIDGKEGWTFGEPLSTMSTDVAVVTLLEDIAASGIELPDNKQAMQDAVKALATAHLANLDVELDCFSIEVVDGVTRYVPSKLEGVPTTLFGIEGGDELVGAICKAFNGYEAAKTIEAVSADEGTKAVKDLAKVIQTGVAFSSMSVEVAARHLMAILVSRLDDEAREVSAADVDAILDAIAVDLEAFRDGSADKADLVAVDTPDTAEDAESEADAA
jgi:hypothetical protein